MPSLTVLDSPVRGYLPRPDLPEIPFGPLVKLLIVADGEASFLANRDFGLTEFVNALQTTSFTFARFKITTAHRSAAGNYFADSADIQDFDFSNPAHFSAASYDVVFLFGFYALLDDTSGAPHRPLTTAEIDAVAEFMQSGGGVFSTGDHEDLGTDLSGSLPRVRHMRRWYFDEAPYKADPSQYASYDESLGWAPPKFGPHRHDTLVAGADGSYRFEDQSDSTPAQITPVIFKSGSGFLSETYPHPLLCGPSGPIRILPDHMHEGECTTPTIEQMRGSFQIGGSAVAEYPKSVYGLAPRPMIVAWGNVIPGHSTVVAGEPNSLDPATLADSFGSVCAYDGHAAGVGRVATDSTIHHFYNINLNGTGANAGPGYKGFDGSPQYEIIKSYFRNLGYWLARPERQKQMFIHTMWAARWDSQLRMQALYPDHEKVTLSSLVTYGQVVQSVMFRFAAPCAVINWTTAVIDPLLRLLGSFWYNLIHLPDPPPEQTVIRPEEVISALLATMMNEVMQARDLPRTPDSQDLTGFYRSLKSHLATGAENGLRALAEANRLRMAASQRFGEQILAHAGEIRHMIEDTQF